MDNYIIYAIIMIVAYTFLMLYVGIGKAYDEKTVSTARGYFIGSGTDYFVLFFTTAATWFSTWIYMGAPGSFYKHGIGWIAGMTWQLLICFFMGYYGPKFWRLSKDRNYLTPADLLDDYYESPVLRTSVSIGQLVFCIPYLMAQVTGVGLAVSTLTDGVIPFTVGVLYAAIVVGIYVYYGGFKSQAWVDTMQGIMFTMLLWISVSIMLSQAEVGGISGLFLQIEKVNERLLHYLHAPEYWTWKMYFSFFIIQAFGGFFAPYVWERMYAAKSGSVVRKMGGTLGFFYTFAIMLPVMLAGYGGAVLFPDIANPDNILVATMSKYAPIWGIFVVIGIMSAGMSTISSILVSASSLISVDIIKQIKPNLNTKELRDIGKYNIIIILLIAVVLSMVDIKGIVVLVNTALAGFAQIAIPVFGVFHWKRATKQGATLGFVTGLIVTIICTTVIPNPLGFVAGIWGLLANLIVFLVVSLMTESVSEEHRANFMKPLKG